MAGFRMMRKVIVCGVMLWLAGCVVVAPAVAEQSEKRAEVIHWWVSGSEGAALQVVINAYEERGYEWLDTPVEASYQAKTAALTRVLDGVPPTAVQWHVGESIRNLYEQSILRDIRDVAEAKGWREALPSVIWERITVDDKVVAAPLTLHGTNWLWANARALKDVGESMPETWDELLAMGPALREAGYIPLALGGQPWQENILFLCVLLSVGGPDLYNAVLVERDPKVLAGPDVIEALRVFQSLQQLVDPGSPDRPWDDATAMVVDGRAAFQVMGDWAKGEFLHAGKTPGEDFLCGLSPGSDPYYAIVSDAFAMTAVTEPEAVAAQQTLAEVIMDPTVQKEFSRIKGSIPPRTDISREGFDMCAVLAMEAVSEDENVLPGINMAVTEVVASAFLETVSAFWNTPGASPDEAARQLAKAVQDSEF